MAAHTRHVTLTLAALTTAAATLTGTIFASHADTISSHGIDVSSHQHERGKSIDWSQAALAGNDFAFVKATEGTGYTNPWFASDINSARLTGHKAGAYHFARPGVSNGVDQANYFANRLLAAPGPKLKPVLDLEDNGGKNPAQLQQWVREFLTTLKVRTGTDPIIYTGPWFWKGYMGNTREFSQYPLWTAEYGVTSPKVYGGWDRWTFWQYTDRASLRGVDGGVDRSVFNGDEGQLVRLMTLW